MTLIPEASSFSRVANVCFAVACLAAWIVNIVGNYLQMATQGSNEIAKNSDRFWIPIAAAGYAFAIWGPIFIGQGLFCAYAIVCAWRDRPHSTLPALTLFLVPNFLLLGAWNWVFAEWWLLLSWVIIVTCAVTGIIMYYYAHKSLEAVGGAVVANGPTPEYPLNKQSATATPTWKRVGNAFLTVGWVRLYVGWITSASILATSITLKWYLGFQNPDPKSYLTTPAWAEPPAPGLPPADETSAPQMTAIEPAVYLAILCVTLVSGSVFAWWKSDPVPALVYAWACSAVVTKSVATRDLGGSQTDLDRWTTMIVGAAVIGLLNLVVATVAGMMCSSRSRGIVAPLAKSLHVNAPLNVQVW